MTTEKVVDAEALQRRIEHLEKGIKEAKNALDQNRPDIAMSWLRIAVPE